MADFIIAIADLVEAEGRQLRQSIHLMALVIGLTFIAVILLLAGILLLLYGFWIYLTTMMPPPLAAFITGIVTLILAGTMLWRLAPNNKP